jgi:hypothetical protein
LISPWTVEENVDTDDVPSNVDGMDDEYKVNDEAMNELEENVPVANVTLYLIGVLCRVRACFVYFLSF